MTRLALPTRSAIVAAVVTAFLTAGAGSAQAVTCNQTLTDAHGFAWQQSDGAMQVNSGGTYQFTVTGQMPSSGLFTFPSGDACTVEDGGREIAVPAQTPPNGGTIEIERKIYVSDGDPAFVRFFDTYRNPLGSSQTVDLAQLVPTTAATRLRSTSSGDAIVTTSDDWAVTANTPTGAATAPAAGEIWTATGFTGRRPSGFAGATTSESWVDNRTTHGIFYEDVTIPPVGSVSMMHLVLLRPPGAGAVEDAAADAAALAAAPAAVYAGLSQAERERLVNWPRDDDGVAEPGDNCPLVSNPDQRNTDGDGTGDACDGDDDGDGLDDGVETALGANPLVADTDGDGVQDNRDSCITLAGPNADGCPNFVTQGSGDTGGTVGGNDNGGGSDNGGGGNSGGSGSGGGTSTPAPQTPQAPAVPLVDRTPPRVSVQKVPSKMKLETFMKGVKGKVRCDEPCSFTFELIGTAQTVRLASTSDVVVGTSSLKLGGGTRSFKVKPNKKLIGDDKKMKIRLRIVATDGAGNHTIVPKTIKVG